MVLNRNNRYIKSDFKMNPFERILKSDRIIIEYLKKSNNKFT